MFALANMVHLFANEFSGLGRRRFASPFVSAGAF